MVKCLELCEDCGKAFLAGPNAFLCEKCRKARLSASATARARDRSKCNLVRAGIVKKKGKPSIEYYDKDGKPVYYCLGYTDPMTEEYYPECIECPKFVDRAEEDRKKMYGG